MSNSTKAYEGMGSILARLPFNTSLKNIYSGVLTEQEQDDLHHALQASVSALIRARQYYELEEEAVDERQRERLGKLREAAERCAKVSKTFLAMARQSPSVTGPPPRGSHPPVLWSVLTGLVHWYVRVRLAYYPRPSGVLPPVRQAY